MVLASVVIVGAGATAVLYYLYRTKTKRVADAPTPAYQNMAYEDAEKKTIPSDVVQFVREDMNEKQWKIEAIAYEMQIYFLKKSRLFDETRVTRSNWFENYAFKGTS